MDRKVVLITGGAMGQGKSHALKFAENGFDVVVNLAAQAGVRYWSLWCPRAYRAWSYRQRAR